MVNNKLWLVAVFALAIALSPSVFAADPFYDDAVLVSNTEVCGGGVRCEAVFTIDVTGTHGLQRNINMFITLEDRQGNVKGNSPWLPDVEFITGSIQNVTYSAPTISVCDGIFVDYNGTSVEGCYYLHELYDVEELVFDDTQLEFGTNYIKVWSDDKSSDEWADWNVLIKNVPTSSGVRDFDTHVKGWAVWGDGGVESIKYDFKVPVNVTVTNDQKLLKFTINSSNFNVSSLDASGFDLVFVDSNHDLLEFNRSSFNIGGDSVFYVNSSQLSAGLNQLWMYYSNNTAISDYSVSLAVSEGYTGTAESTKYFTTSSVLADDTGSYTLIQNNGVNTVDAVQVPFKGETVWASYFDGTGSNTGSTNANAPNGDYPYLYRAVVMNGNPTFTVSGWMRNWDSVSTYTMLWYERGGSYGDIEMVLYPECGWCTIVNATGWRMNYGNQQNSLMNQYNNFGQAQDYNNSEWLHWVGTYDDVTDNLLKLYINGVLTDTPGSQSGGGSASQTRIGSDRGGGNAFTGYMHDVRGWIGTRLTDADVMDLYLGVNHESPTVAFGAEQPAFVPLIAPVISEPVADTLGAFNVSWSAAVGSGDVGYEVLFSDSGSPFDTSLFDTGGLTTSNVVDADNNGNTHGGIDLYDVKTSGFIKYISWGTGGLATVRDYQATVTRYDNCVDLNIIDSVGGQVVTTGSTYTRFNDTFNFYVAAGDCFGFGPNASLTGNAFGGNNLGVVPSQSGELVRFGSPTNDLWHQGVIEMSYLPIGQLYVTINPPVTVASAVFAVIAYDDFSVENDTTSSFLMDTYNVESCKVINDPGDYVLIQDVVSDASPCIHINSTGVTFDGMGYTVSGGTKPVHVDSSATGAYVNNFTVSSSYTAYVPIFDVDASGVVVEDMTLIMTNAHNGAVLFSNGPSTYFNRINATSLGTSYSPIGIFVMESDHVDINNSVFTSGHTVFDTSENQVGSNYFRLHNSIVNMTHGDTSIYSNVFLDSASQPISFQLINNTVTTVAPTVPMFRPDSNSVSWTVRDNTFDGYVTLQNTFGVWTNNVFFAPFIMTVTQAGGYLDMYNNWFDSTYALNDGAGRIDAYIAPEPGVRVNGVAGSQIGGNYYADYSPSCADVAPADGFCDVNRSVGTNVVDIYPLAPIHELTACQVISESGNYLVTQSFSGFSSDNACIYVTADDVTINTGAYTIGTSAQYAVHAFGVTNFIMNDGTFTGNAAIRLESVDGFEVNDVTVTKLLSSTAGGIKNGLFKDITALSTANAVEFHAAENIEISGGVIRPGTFNDYGLHLWGAPVSGKFINITVHDVLFTTYNQAVNNVNMVYLDDGENIEFYNNTFESPSNPSYLDRSFLAFNTKGFSFHDNYVEGIRGIYFAGSDASNEIYNNEFTSDIVLMDGSANVTFYGNLVNTSGSVANGSTIFLNKSGVGNTWTNSGQTGFSDLCVNDWSDMCVEDNVIGLSTDYYPVALSAFGPMGVSLDDPANDTLIGDVLTTFDFSVDSFGGSTNFCAVSIDGSGTNDPATFVNRAGSYTTTGENLVPFRVHKDVVLDVFGATDPTARAADDPSKMVIRDDVGSLIGIGVFNLVDESYRFDGGLYLPAGDYQYSLWNDGAIYRFTGRGEAPVYVEDSVWTMDGLGTPFANMWSTYTYTSPGIMFVYRPATSVSASSSGVVNVTKELSALNNDALDHLWNVECVDSFVHTDDLITGFGTGAYTNIGAAPKMGTELYAEIDSVLTTVTMLSDVSGDNLAAELYDLSGNLLATGSEAGDVYTFNYDLVAGTTYRLVASTTNRLYFNQTDDVAWPVSNNYITLTKASIYHSSWQTTPGFGTQTGAWESITTVASNADDGVERLFSVLDYSIIPTTATHVSCPSVLPNELNLPAPAELAYSFDVFRGQGIVDPSVSLRLYRGGQSTATVDESACTIVVNSGQSWSYTCNLSMNYWFEDSWFTADLTVVDVGEESSYVRSSGCVYGQLLASQQSDNSIAFTDAAPGIVDSPSDNSITILNTGNRDLVATYLTAHDLSGRAQPAVSLAANRFKAGASIGTAVTLEDGVAKNLGIAIPAGENAQDDVLFWLSMPSGQVIQDYYAPDAWVIS